MSQNIGFGDSANELNAVEIDLFDTANTGFPFIL